MKVALFVSFVLVGCVLGLTEEEEMCLGEGANKAIRCGWCASDQKCLSGLASGPVGHNGARSNCSVWDFAFCSQLPCASHESCDACAADPMCGWCSTSNVCAEGSSRGPVFMACIKRDWLNEQEMCPKKPAPCPCPLPDGSCPSKSACDRNNHIAHKVVAAGEEPEDLDKVKCYDSVEGQIPQDVDVPKLLVPTEEEAPKENLIAANPDVYMPVSDDATKVEIAETQVADPPKPE